MDFHRFVPPGIHCDGFLLGIRHAERVIVSQAQDNRRRLGEEIFIGVDEIGRGFQLRPNGVHFQSEVVLGLISVHGVNSSQMRPLFICG